MRRFYFDHSQYWAHTTIAFPVVAVCACVCWLAFTSGRDLPFYLSGTMAALILVSDPFACVVMSQVSYLWHHSFCPWYMAAELWPLRGYLQELRSILALARSDDSRVSATALLDLVAHAMVPVRAVFYIVVVNTLFFAYCYRALILAIRLLVTAASALWRAASCAPRLLIAALGPHVSSKLGTSLYKDARPAAKKSPSALRRLWLWAKSALGL